MIADPKRLRAASRKAQKSQARADLDRANLQAIIREEHRAGATFRELAAEVGLTFARIHQICSAE